MILFCREDASVHYRLYLLDASGRIRSATDLEGADDGEALDRAESLRAEAPAELWQGARLVQRLSCRAD